MTEASTIYRMRLPEGSESLPAVPSRMMGRLLDLMRHKFSSPEHIFRPELRDMLYDPAHEDTSLLIVPGFEANPDTDKANVFPRVTVSTGQFQALRDPGPVTEDMMTLTDSRDGYLGSHSRMVSFVGTASVTAASRAPFEALAMAEDILIWLTLLREDICCSLRLSRFDATLLEGPTLKEGAPSCHTAGVRIEWATSLVWETVPDGLPLGEIATPATT